MCNYIIYDMNIQGAIINLAIGERTSYGASANGIENPMGVSDQRLRMSLPSQVNAQHCAPKNDRATASSRYLFSVAILPHKAITHRNANRCARTTNQLILPLRIKCSFRFHQHLLVLIISF